MNSLVNVSDLILSKIDLEECVFLDATTQKNVLGLHPKYPNLKIKGALKLDLDLDFRNLKNPLPNTKPTLEKFTQKAQELGLKKAQTIFIYDQIGTYTSPRAWWLLLYFGFENVHVINGGLNQWIAHGLATEPITEKANFTVSSEENYKEQELLFCNLEIIKKVENNSNVSIVDARSSDRFQGKVSEKRSLLKSGHIPNSINIPFENLLNDSLEQIDLDKATKCFKTSKNQQHIFTCGSGITACILTLAATAIGYENCSVYDGSWSEYGQL